MTEPLLLRDSVIVLIYRLNVIFAFKSAIFSHPNMINSIRLRACSYLMRLYEMRFYKLKKIYLICKNSYS